MKRSPLRRRTPLRSRTPLRPVGRKARREASALDAARRILRERSEGLCEMRTPACPPGPHPGCDPHHLCHADRDRAVHDPERMRWVCRAAHEYAETAPDRYERGFLWRDDGGAS